MKIVNCGHAGTGYAAHGKAIHNLKTIKDSELALTSGAWQEWRYGFVATSRMMSASGNSEIMNSEKFE